MGSRMHWRGANMQEDIAAQGTFQIGQGQDHEVQYEEIRNDMVKRSSHIFTECVDEWTARVENNAPDYVNKDPEGIAM
eukprot:6122913-Prorocentrum_lima.AAC.1